MRIFKNTVFLSLASVYVLLKKLIELPKVFAGRKKYDFIINFHIFLYLFSNA